VYGTGLTPSCASWVQPNSGSSILLEASDYIPKLTVATPYCRVNATFVNHDMRSSVVDWQSIAPRVAVCTSCGSRKTRRPEDHEQRGDDLAEPC
jgi:hypothetical protein